MRRPADRSAGSTAAAGPRAERDARSRFSRVLDLDPAIGHERRGTRPCIVVSNADVIAGQRFPLTGIVPVTGTSGRGVLYPSLQPGPSGLVRESYALVDHVRSVDKRRVRRVFGRIRAEECSRSMKGSGCSSALAPLPDSRITRTDRSAAVIAVDVLARPAPIGPEVHVAEPNRRMSPLAGRRPHRLDASSPAFRPARSDDAPAPTPSAPQHLVEHITHESAAHVSPVTAQSPCSRSWYSSAAPRAMAPPRSSAPLTAGRSR